MKVEVAKTKICPFMSNSQDIDLGNGYIKNGHYSNCSCGNCMAWQYTEVQETKAMGTVHKKVVDVDHETEDGYCKRIEK